MSTLCNYSGAYIFMNGIVTIVDTSAAAAVTQPQIMRINLCPIY